jgi:hypothetical protein
VASPAGKGKGPANGGAGLAKDVVSPGELCGFVSAAALFIASQLERRVLASIRPDEACYGLCPVMLISPRPGIAGISLMGAELGSLEW